MRLLLTESRDQGCITLWVDGEVWEEFSEMTVEELVICLNDLGLDRIEEIAYRIVD